MSIGLSRSIAKEGKRNIQILYNNLRLGKVEKA
jgi:hypothetical protein